MTDTRAPAPMTTTAPTPSFLKRSSTIWRRLSRRMPRSMEGDGVGGADEHKTTQNEARVPQRLQRRRTDAAAALQSGENRKMRQGNVVAHIQRVDAPPSTNRSRTHTRTQSSAHTSTHASTKTSTHSSAHTTPPTTAPSTPPHTSTPPRARALPSTLPTTSFPSPSPHIHTVPWHLPLTPSQIHTLILGFAPQSMDDKWFIYAEGPDRSGKLKVHFHRSWTGLKIAELFVVVDMEGGVEGEKGGEEGRGKGKGGGGRIVGVKWNGGEETNGLEREEARYMVRTTCRWVLGVELEGE
ncbi:hypothetical protein BDV95DRAFT_615802 [Massariosphaeria phaeospora]|uniref:Uncharacterized protein n=1 Tax=Massariosphaeria phaeospora TaxID=100035 RepID=A0A7C8MEN7_9PLEO|nr:hypothetical protein BDV95DRAFT_615802 [Massariosphaeria phaeospora]